MHACIGCWCGDHWLVVIKRKLEDVIATIGNLEKVNLRQLDNLIIVFYYNTQIELQ